MFIRARSKSTRAQHANAIAEIGPALFILLILIAFPLIDLLGLALVYNAGAILNGIQVREAALEPFSSVNDSSGTVKKGLADAWSQSGIGQFCKLEGKPETTITYKSGFGGDKIVVVTTSLVASPIVPIPFFNAVPALGAPVPLSYTSEHVVENPDNAPPGI